MLWSRRPGWYAFLGPVAQRFRAQEGQCEHVPDHLPTPGRTKRRAALGASQPFAEYVKWQFCGVSAVLSGQNEIEPFALKRRPPVSVGVRGAAGTAGLHICSLFSCLKTTAFSRFQAAFSQLSHHGGQEGKKKCFCSDARPVLGPCSAWLHPITDVPIPHCGRFVKDEMRQATVQVLKQPSLCRSNKGRAESVPARSPKENESRQTSLLHRYRRMLPRRRRSKLRLPNPPHENGRQRRKAKTFHHPCLPTAQCLNLSPLKTDHIESFCTCSVCTILRFAVSLSQLWRLRILCHHF